MAKNIILTSGNAYIDIDAYASCLAYRELLLAQGKKAKAVTTAPFAKNITKSLQELSLTFDEYTPTNLDEFIILLQECQLTCNHILAN